MKKYRIFPKRAMITLLIILLISSIILVIVDNNMPQYGTWTQENAFINRDRKIKMEQIKREIYPLISLTSSDISQSENKKKIMVIGDSYIEGDGYSNLNQTWWRQLEVELHNRGYYDVEIVGVGTDGSSTQDEVRWLTQTNLIEEVDPDLIMIGYIVNDPELEDENGNVIIKYTKTTDYFSQNNLLKTIYQMFPNISYKINNMLNQKANKTKEYNDETGYPFDQWCDIIINEKWLGVYYEKAIKPLGEYLNSIDTPSFVINTPNSTTEGNKYHVFSLFEEAGIKTYNMFDQYEAYIKTIKNNLTVRRINPVNGHPGTAHTKFYAEYVADLLEREYANILGQKYQETITYPICINDWVPYGLDTQKIKEEENAVTYQITYPDQDNMLYMPIEKKYIKLSLEHPVEIKEIELDGEHLKEAEIYLTQINEELGYDDQTLHRIGTEKGSQEAFKIEEKKLITSICISADITKGSKLEITIKR